MIDLREALIRKNREFDVVGFEIEEIKNFIINNYTFQIDGIYGDIGKEIFEFLDIKQINNKFPSTSQITISNFEKDKFINAPSFYFSLNSLPKLSL